MLFFSNRSNLHLDCFTKRQEVFDYAKIESATNFLPKWWKDLPKTRITDNFLPLPTMKTCVGMVDYYKLGLIYPLWSDISFLVGSKTEPNFKWNFADGISDADIHPTFQRGGYLPPEEYQHVKLYSPWLLTCKEDLNWSMTQPTWNFDALGQIHIVPGLMNFNYIPQPNINIFLRRGDESYSFLIKHGQPMMHILPMSNKKIVLHHHLVDEKEYAKINYKVPRLSFNNNFRKFLNIKNKCPFHNHD